MKKRVQKFYLKYFFLLFLIIVGFLVFSGKVSAAVISSAQSGDWNSTSTWVGGVIPGDGDAVTIVSPNTVIIPNGISITVGTDINGNAAITVNNGATLLVKGSLTLHGDLLQTRNSTVEVGDATVGGGTLIFDPAPGNTHIWQAISDGAVGNGVAKITGIVSNRATVTTSARGGNNGWIDFYTNGFHSLSFDVNYANISNLGGSSTSAINYVGNYISGHYFKIKNALLNTVGLVSASEIAGDQDLEIDTVDVRFPLDTRVNRQVFSLGPDTKTTGSRIFKNVTVYNPDSARYIWYNVANSTAENLVLYNTVFYIQAVQNNIIMDKIFSIMDSVSGTNYGILSSAVSGQILQNSVLISHLVNPHTVALTGNIFGNVISGDKYLGGDAGDIYLDGDNAIFENNFVLENAGALHIGGTKTDREILNNTFVGDYSFISIGEDNPTGASALKSIKNNIFYNGDLTSNSVGVRELSFFQSMTNLSEDYNNIYGNLGDLISYSTGPLAGQQSCFGPATFNPWFSDGREIGSVNAGQNDKALDPQFKNSTATVRGYVGGNNLAEMAQIAVTINGWDYQANPTSSTPKTTLNVLNYIRDAFSPTNVSLKSAGFDGSDIGAVSVSDVDAPTGTISINSGSTSTNSTTISLVLSATDNLAVTQMKFSDDGITYGATTTYATSSSYTISAGDGTKVVYVKFADASGNWSLAASSSILLDTAAPTTSIDIDSGTYNNNQTITLTCGDGSGSGCDKIYYTTDGTEPTVTSTQYSSPITISSNSTLKFFAKDLLGNSENAQTKIYIIIKDPPVINSVSIISNSNRFINPILISATDNVGVTGYLLNESAETPSLLDSGWTSSKPNTYEVSSIGNHTIYIWVKNGSGRLASSTVSITITPSGNMVSNISNPVVNIVSSNNQSIISNNGNSTISNSLVSNQTVNQNSTNINIDQLQLRVDELKKQLEILINSPQKGSQIITNKPILIVGNKNLEIKQFQSILQNKGFFPKNIEPNGVFGPATKQAVIKFQKKNKIPATGNIGPLTRKALGN